MEMSRTDIINYLGGYFNYQTYLEIGVFLSWNFGSVHFPSMLGVDPKVRNTPNVLQMTSDEFFEANEKTFDFIFIDGLHHADQVYTDIQNSIKFLNPNGTIMCHDLNPKTYDSQVIPFGAADTGHGWHGDCWKAWIQFRQETTEYKTFCIDTDCGCGIIRKSKTPVEPIKVDCELTYENLEKNRKEWLNLISVETFEDNKSTLLI